MKFGANIHIHTGHKGHKVSPIASWTKMVSFASMYSWKSLCWGWKKCFYWHLFLFASFWSCHCWEESRFRKIIGIYFTDNFLVHFWFTWASTDAKLFWIAVAATQSIWKTGNRILNDKWILVSFPSWNLVASLLFPTGIIYCRIILALTLGCRLQVATMLNTAMNLFLLWIE